MFKKILTSSSLLFSFFVIAQAGTSSPYSAYGLGETKYNGTLESRSMGGIFVAPDSTHVNLQNPASFSTLKLTSFTLGAGSSIRKYQSENQTSTAQRTQIDYFAAGISMGKLGLAFGSMPYASTGYKIQIPFSDTSTTNRTYDASGGLNSLFIGLGYNILSNLSIGADIHSIFGDSQKSSLLYITDITNGINQVDKAKISGLEYNFGIMYQMKMTKKTHLYSSLNYTPSYTMTISNTQTISTVVPGSGSNLITIDAFDPAVSELKLKIGSKILFGIGIGQDKKWQFAGQIITKDLSSYAQINPQETNVEYGKYSRYSMGGYYIPNYSNYASYFKRITYRGGLKYEQTGLTINTEPIVDYGFSLGTGFPIPGTFSNVNLGIELGRKGTISNTLIRENYFNINASFSFNDRWFVKRKID